MRFEDILICQIVPFIRYVEGKNAQVRIAYQIVILILHSQEKYDFICIYQKKVVPL